MLESIGTLSVEGALSLAHDRLERIDQRMLLSYAMQRPIAWLLAHPEAMLSPIEEAKYSALLARREAGEPVAYLVGEREFHGLSFEVTPDVLIPRPETELLVDRVLESIPANSDARVIDLGTGSGAIAVTLAVRRPNIEVVAVDNSVAALEVARRNAERMRVGHRIEFREARWFSGMPGQLFDVIVSNPPYVAEKDAHLTQGDVRFEPRQALVGGIDGLQDLAVIIELSTSHLPLGGILALEHGYDQAGVVRRLMTAAGFVSVRSSEDLSGIERVTEGRYRVDLREGARYSLDPTRR
jgi:release factor glutamine methyltransferase